MHPISRFFDLWGAFLLIENHSRLRVGLGFCLGLRLQETGNGHLDGLKRPARSRETLCGKWSEGLLGWRGIVSNPLI